MHDPLTHHIAHHFVTFSLDHFVTFSLDRLLLPIDMTKFTPSLSSLYAQLYANSSTVRSTVVIAHAQLPPLIGHSLLFMIAPTEPYPLFAPSEFAPLPPLHA